MNTILDTQPAGKKWSGFMMFAAPVAILLCAAAMNGGALTASGWDTMVTQLRSLLTSTWVIVLLLVVLIACVWQLAHGGGYKSISFVIGILGIALIGPDFIVDLATAMPDATQMQIIKNTVVPVINGV
eukprot:gene29904-33743_t